MSSRRDAFTFSIGQLRGQLRQQAPHGHIAERRHGRGIIAMGHDGQRRLRDRLARHDGARRREAAPDPRATRSSNRILFTLSARNFMIEACVCTYCQSPPLS